MKFIDLYQTAHMKPKSIIISIVLALLVIILFNNKEEASFWLFGEIRTSKLIILGIFFLLGVITGALVFRRKSKQPKEYTVSGFPVPDEKDLEAGKDNNLSESDREYLSRD